MHSRSTISFKNIVCYLIPFTISLVCSLTLGEHHTHSTRLTSSTKSSPIQVNDPGRRGGGRGRDSASNEDIIYQQQLQQHPAHLVTIIPIMEAQYDEPLNNQQKVVDTSLYDVANNSLQSISNINQSKPVYELNQQFLNLFDDLWRIKNSSASTLNKLDQLQRNQTLLADENNNNNSSTNYNYNYGNSYDDCRRFQDERSCNMMRNRWPQGERYGTKFKQQLQNKLLTGSLSFEMNKLRDKTGVVNGGTGLKILVSSISSWLTRLNQRFNSMVAQLCTSLLAIKHGRAKQSTSITNVSRQPSLSSNANDDVARPTGEQTADETSPSSGMDVQLANETMRSKRDVLVNLNVGRLLLRRDLVGNRRGPRAATATAAVASDQLDDAKLANYDSINSINSIEPTALDNCNKLTIDEEQKCVAAEELINTRLNYSFPGTLVSIEDNCRHVTFLIANCWPQQLQQLKGTSSSWNESLLALTEFPLPINTVVRQARNQQQQQQAQYPLAGGQGSYLQPIIGGGSTTRNNGGGLVVEPPSCGLPVGQSRTPQPIKDRSVWMWLNMCLDRRFRHDYVDNLRCLSLWNQDRAQSVCGNEYKRMQGYIAASQTSLEAGGQSTSEGNEASTWTSANASTQAGSGNNYRLDPKTLAPHSADHYNQSQTTELHPTYVDHIGGGTSIMDHLSSSSSSTSSASNLSPTSGGVAMEPNSNSKGSPGSETNQLEREISSKMLCCMFDQFLRCVNRQAIRDCGRPGAQFVVNFMSRIGTDDMRYLCNNEARQMALGSSPTQTRTTQTLGSGSRGPPTTITSSGSQSSGGVASQATGGGGGRRSGGHHDKSPFIENNYCSDPRIQNALFGSLGAGGGGGSGGSHGSDSRSKHHHHHHHHQQPGQGNNGPWQPNHPGGRGKSRTPAVTVSHDPTFFGSDTGPFSGCPMATYPTGALVYGSMAALLIVLHCNIFI